MKIDKKQINNNFIIFFIIAFVYAISNFIWWKNNTPIIPMFDSAVHFTDLSLPGYFFQNAPLITWVMRVMFYIFGKEYYDLIIIFVNYIFFLIPLYFIYKIGTELKDKETGNIAMILFALVPAVYGMSRHYGHQDYHIIAGITFNIYCLIKTDYFRDRKWTIWYGISVGLGLMIKDAFLAYFFVPFVYIAIAGLREKIEKTKIINILISILIGSLISGWHYFRLFIIQKILYEPLKERVLIVAFESLRVMTIGLWEYLLSPPIFIIFIIGLIYFIWKYKGEYKNVILLWFFVPWAIIILMPHRKLPEYGAGFIPAIILICAVFITCIKHIYVKKIILMLLVFACFLQYIDFSNFLNIKFFNIKWRFKEYTILYYDKYPNWAPCNDQEERKYIQILINHLKNKKFKDFILISQTSLDISSIVAWLTFNNMYCMRWSDINDKDDVSISKILIVIGSQKTIGEITNLQIEQYMQDPLNRKYITEEFKEKLLEKNKCIFDKIDKNYHVIDIFYLDDNKNEKTKVTLLGMKDQFPEFEE